jgi:hypothetical protein
MITIINVYICCVYLSIYAIHTYFEPNYLTLFPYLHIYGHEKVHVSSFHVHVIFVKL